MPPPCLIQNCDVDPFEVQAPLRWLQHSLAETLATAVRLSGAVEAVLQTPSIGEIRFHRRMLEQPDSGVLPFVPARAVARQLSPPATVRVFGPISLRFDWGSLTPEAEGTLPSLARHADSLLRRHSMRLRTAQHTGVEIAGILIGNSVALQLLLQAIDKIARAEQPVMVEAEFGAGGPAVAAAIHGLSDRASAPFFTVHCACQRARPFRRTISNAFEQAGRGTLFFDGVDTLDGGMQRDLLAELTAREDSSLFAARVVASTTVPLDAVVRGGQFCRFLSARLDRLRLFVPPLRERRDDIPLLLEHEISERLNSGKRLTRESLEACLDYDWPGNLGELGGVAARLAVMSSSEQIGLEDVRLNAPLILRSIPSESRMAEEAGHAAGSGPEGSPPNGSDRVVPPIPELARRLVDGHLRDLDRCGVALQRALTFVSSRYQSDISLGELAESAHLSPSHLSFLFKKVLGAPFKTVLAAVRIEKARRLLREKPDLSITEVSLDAGFGDLSHFEKTFKKIVGVNPREFRRRGRVENRNSHQVIAAGIALPLE